MNYTDIKSGLKERREILENMIRRIDSRTRIRLSEWGGELSGYDNHIDIGTTLFLREHDQVIRHRIKTDLQNVKAAEDALESGSYGICKRCGIPIDDQRLKALPESLSCVECAEETETDLTYLIAQGAPEPNEFWDEMAVWGSSNTIQDGQAEVEIREDQPL